MKNNSENKVLYAINHATAEKHLSKAIKDSGSKVEIVGTVVSNESLIDFLSTKQVDTLVYSDRLPGKENAFDFLMKLKRIYKSLRIVLIANEMNKGDVRLATLVAYGIWDIKYGDGIALSEVAKMIVTPSTYEQASVHLPDDVDWIKLDYGRSKNNAEDKEDHIKMLTSQLGEVNRSKAAISEKLDAAEARCRELELANASLQAEHSKQMLNKENQFIEEKAVLSDRISVLINEKTVVQKKYDEEVKEHKKLSDKYEELSTAAKNDIDALTNKVSTLETELSAKNEEYDALTRKQAVDTSEAEKYSQDLIKNAELQRDQIIKSAEQERDRTIREANETKDEIIASAEQDKNEIISEAETKSREIISEAEQSKDKIILEAEANRDKILKETEDRINETNAEKIELINETALKSQLIIAEAEQKLSDSEIKSAEMLKQAHEEADKVIEEANRILSEAKTQVDESENKVEDATKNAEAIIVSAKEEAEKIKNEAVQKASDLAYAEANNIQTVEKQKLRDELTQMRKDVELECAAKYEKCAADIAFEKDQKQFKINEMESTIKNLEQHKARLEESVDSIRSKISDEKLKLESELASCEAMLADVRAQKEKELLELEKEYANRASMARDMHAEEDKKIVEEAKAETDKKLKSIESAFTYEKKRLAKDFEKYKINIDAEKMAYAEENKVVDYQFDINKFDITSGCYNRCVPIMCMSTIPGAGTSAVALNVATMLAIGGSKTLYVELDSRNPTFITNMLVSNIKESLEPCFKAISEDNFDVIDANIISKQKILNADISAKRKDMHERLPDMLHYMVFNTDKMIKNHATVDIVKALVTYVAGKKGYKYIVCDLPSWFTKDELADLYKFTNNHIVVMNQDHVTIKRLDKMLKVTEDHRKGNKALTDVYVMNKTLDNSNLTVGRAKDILKLEEIINIPMNLSEFLLGASNGLPPVLFSKNNEFCAKMKIISDRFK